MSAIVAAATAPAPAPAAPAPAPALVIKGVTIPATLATQHAEDMSTLATFHADAVATLETLANHEATVWATKAGTIKTAHTATTAARAPLQARINASAPADVARLVAGNYGAWFADVAAALSAPQSKIVADLIKGSPTVGADGVKTVIYFEGVAQLRGRHAFEVVAGYLDNPYVWKNDKATKTQTKEPVTFAKSGKGANLQDLARVARLALAVLKYQGEVKVLEQRLLERARLEPGQGE